MAQYFAIRIEGEGTGGTITFTGAFDPSWGFHFRPDTPTRINFDAAGMSLTPTDAEKSRFVLSILAIQSNIRVVLKWLDPKNNEVNIQVSGDVNYQAQNTNEE